MGKITNDYLEWAFWNVPIKNPDCGVVIIGNYSDVSYEFGTNQEDLECLTYSVS